MINFDGLPQTTRSLLLTRASLEIVSANCLNILELAKKRKQPVSAVWNDICQKAGLPRCQLPADLIKAHHSTQKL
jgi:hypothetical protein